MQAPTLSDEALKVLRALRERALDGYSLMSKTGLDRTKLYEGIRELVGLDLVNLKGDLNPELIGEAYLVVPPSVFGYADMLLGQLRFKRAQ
jgi:DNA-binding IclR family transcriptional regulator